MAITLGFILGTLMPKLPTAEQSRMPMALRMGGQPLGGLLLQGHTPAYTHCSPQG